MVNPRLHGSVCQRTAALKALGSRLDLLGIPSDSYHKPMGLFDSLANQLLGGQPAAILENLLREAGGLAGMRDRFDAAGLQDVFASWVGNGENRSIHPTDLQNIMGSEALQALAARVGFSAETILPLMAQFLPQVVDRLTPNGHIEAGLPSMDQLRGIVSDVMKGGLSSLFGR